MAHRQRTKRGFSIKRSDVAAVAAAIVVFLTAILPAAFAADTITISQRNRTFDPGAVTIARDTTLHIVNDDRVTHHVYVDAPNFKFDSGEQPVGKSVDLLFDKTGTFTVLCAIHPTMKLLVTVQ